MVSATVQDRMNRRDVAMLRMLQGKRRWSSRASTDSRIHGFKSIWHLFRCHRRWPSKLSEWTMSSSWIVGLLVDVGCLWILVFASVFFCNFQTSNIIECGSVALALCWFHAKVHWWILEWTVWQLSLSGQYCRCILQWSKFGKNTAHVTLQRNSVTQERPATAIGGEVAIFTDVWLSHHEGWELCAFIYGYIDLLEASLCSFLATWAFGSGGLMHFSKGLLSLL